MQRSRYDRPEGFDAKADAVRRASLLEAMRREAVPASVVDVFTSGGDALVLQLTEERVRLLADITNEQRCAAVGFRAEGATLDEVAKYLFGVCDAASDAHRAEHEAQYQQTTGVSPVPMPALRVSDIPPPSQDASPASKQRNSALHPSSYSSPPVPKLRGVGGSATRGQSPRVSTPGSRAGTPRDPVHRALSLNHSESDAGTPRRASPRPSSTGQVARSPRLSTSYYEQQRQLMREERAAKETRLIDERRKVNVRTEYDRARSRSRSRSPGASSTATGSEAGVSKRRTTTRPALWQPRQSYVVAAGPRALAASDRTKLRKTFGESAHRSSYLPAEVRSKANTVLRSTGPAGHLNPSLRTAFERLETQKRAAEARRRTAVTPPPTVSRARRQASHAQSDAPAVNEAPTEEGNPAPQPATAAAEEEDESPPGVTNEQTATFEQSSSSKAAPLTPRDGGNTTPRLSAAREERILADFHAQLEREGLRPEGWAELSERDREAHFDRWNASRVTRRVVADAYTR